MRQRIVAGNWKMNTTLEEGLQLAGDVAKDYIKNRPGDIELIMAPPFTHISELVKATAGSGVKYAAQNCASEKEGAFTGEVSVAMIRTTGATHVIIGHSERRTLFSEKDEVLFKKVRLALEESLIPIFCCGELLEEREAGNHFEVVKKQLYNTLFRLDEVDFRKVIIAYEPVWAIGTGKTATPEQAQEMQAAIRKMIAERYDEETANDIPILYGGSCKASNAAEIFAQPDVDGGLIGGASLKADEFMQIARSF
ncbi:MAG: triose-phosphate isomerase [Bacteroidales bacterium]